MAKRLRSDSADRGAAMVEFTLVLVLFLSLIFALVQYGWAFYQKQEGSFAAREGARQAAVGTLTAAQICRLVNSKVSTSDVVRVTVSGAVPGTPPVVGEEITVNTSFAATRFNLPFIPFPANLQLTETAKTRTEDVKAGTSTYLGTTQTCSD